MVLLLIVLLLLGLGGYAWACGSDSRDGEDWSPPRP
jgi:hypothetical protein